MGGLRMAEEQAVGLTWKGISQRAESRLRLIQAVFGNRGDDLVAFMSTAE